MIDTIRITLLFAGIMQIMVNLLAHPVIFVVTLALVQGSAALPQASTTSATTTAASASGNPFTSATLRANTYYADEVLQTAIPSLSNQALAPEASAVAQVPTFFWL